MVVYTKGNAATDKSGYEIRKHGSTSFPIACYSRRLEGDPVTWHYHTEFELIINTSGRVFVQVPDDLMELKAGSVCFINSGVLHSVRCPENGTGEVHSLVLAPRLLTGSSESVFNLKYIKPLMDSPLRFANLDDVAACEIIEKVYTSCLAEEEGYEIWVRNYLSEFFLKLVELSKMSISKEPVNEIRNEQRIKAMLSFIQSNAAEPIAVEDIAGAAGISRRECLRCFRQTLNTTPSKYLSDFRLEKAAELLRSTGLKIIDLSTECGYEDPSYFTRVFSKKFGCTPREYRKQSFQVSEQ